MIRVKYTGTVTAKFTKTLEFHDQAEYDDFKANAEGDNLLCNIEVDDVQIEELDSFTSTVVSQ